MIIRMLQQLKQHRQLLTKQQIRTLKGQILAGDVEGAEKGLNKILNERSETK